MSEPSSPAPEMSDARKRAEARKAKILARGTTGLAKLASTARGEEASVLYDTSSPVRSNTPKPSTPNASSHSEPSASSFSPASSGNDPSLAYQAQLEQMMSMMGGAGGPGMSGGFAGQPDFMAQMQAMLGGGGGLGGGPNMSSPLALRDVDPSADPPSPSLAGQQADFAAMMAGNGNGGGFPGLPPGFDPSAMFGPGGAGIGVGMGEQQPPSFIAKLFPAIHVGAVFLFWMFTVMIWEPSVRQARLGVIGLANEKWLRYGLLDGARRILPATDTMMEKLPVFWAFITMEVLLQSTQFMLFKPQRKTGGILGLISNFLPLLPRNIQILITTTTRYASMLNQIWRDGCLLVFLIGLTVVWAGRQGSLGNL